MIDRDKAHTLATQLLGQRPFQLQAFPYGFVIQADEAHTSYGQGLLVIEAETGTVLLFPSSVPRRAVIEHYPELRQRAVRVHGAV